MKRSTLQRKTPMARGTSQLARSEFKSRTSAKPRRTAPPKVKDTPRPRITTTAVEQAHRDRVARIGCVVCIRLGFSASPAELHHARTFAGGGQKSTEFHVIPLCPAHHRLGGAGVALHAGRQTFARLYGSEPELLLYTLRMLGLAVFPEQLARPDLGALLYPQGA